MDRRHMLQGLGLGILGLMGGTNRAVAKRYSRATNGLPRLKITNVKAILTCPQGQRLIVVKVETSEPGLYGLGCATFNQRSMPVAVAIDEY